MCKLSRAAQLDRQDRAQGMIDISESSSIIASSWRCTNGRGSSASDSLECRNGHSEASMDITQQSPHASVAHQRFLFTGEKICIDCHKGIAHHQPDMRGVPAGSNGTSQPDRFGVFS